MKKLVTTIALLCFCSTRAMAINTHKDWVPGIDDISGFGCGSISNFGQSVKVPVSKHTIGSFSFYLQKWSGFSGTGVVRGEIYRWDPKTHRPAEPAIFESKPRTLAFGDSNFHRVTFHPNVSVTPGAQYLVFLTTDRDNECAGNPYFQWGGVDGSTYAGGSFYFLSAGGDPSNWEMHSWDTYSGFDAAFVVTLPN